MTGSFAALAVVACGGSEFTSVASTTDGGIDATSPADGSTTGPDGAILPTDGSTSGSEGGTISNDGATGTADGATTDGAAPATIECLGGRCNRQTQVCCYSANTNPPPELVASCGTASDCATKSGTALKCSTAAECGTGEVCCIAKQGNGHASSCKSACVAPEGQLCDPNSISLTKCPITAACSTNKIDTWGLTTHFGTCGGVSG